jgi:hypothetical protein
MLPAHQLQGELAISVPRHRHLRATITLIGAVNLTTFENILGLSATGINSGVEYISHNVLTRRLARRWQFFHTVNARRTKVPNF